MSLLRKWFGASQDEIWRQLSLEIGADYTAEFWTGKKVQAQHGEWTITLDNFVLSTGKSAIPFTRLRAPFVNQDGFTFVIFRKQIFADLARWFGMQDIEIGHPEFDEAFVIQGNDEKKVRALLASAKVRELIQAQPSILLSVRGDQGWFSRIYPEGVDELYFQVGGVVRDLDLLKKLFDLFALTLDQLCLIGSAYEKDPGVKL